MNHNDDNSELNQTAPPPFRSTAPVCVSNPAFTFTIMMKRLVMAILKKIEIRKCQNKRVYIYAQLISNQNPMMTSLGFFPKVRL